MNRFVDLHSHWVSGVDDGVRTENDGIELLRRLYQVGFSTVVATPHMRPGMFDNDQARLREGFAAMLPRIAGESGMPHVHLASEHFFDDVIFGRLKRGEGLPYPAYAPSPGQRAALIEFPAETIPARAAHRIFDLKRSGLAIVLAHPERYQPVWKDDTCLDPILDAGAHLLLDICSLVGKYGKAPQKAAEKLLEEDAYEAACSDAHRPSDVDDVARAIDRLRSLVGIDEATRLLRDGPAAFVPAPPNSPATSPGDTPVM